ncbi:hypothetical protein F3Y22_tig00113722pilonHSYRG00067 [Hibiscus syriacus]|uniref:Uncharacterized protein n=1 Tax=Hibiscus syriacus TaxID=106335 RepID=A0A6A2WN13_HIBSY|nr:hypothetical protein F3Y22_tig00113722pilonHSYRG00067 [Hibiscus syriacus]
MASKASAAITLLLSLNLLFFSMADADVTGKLTQCPGTDLSVCVDVLPLRFSAEARVAHAATFFQTWSLLMRTFAFVRGEFRFVHVTRDENAMADQLAKVDFWHSKMEVSTFLPCEELMDKEEALEEYNQINLNQITIVLL